MESKTSQISMLEEKIKFLEEQSRLKEIIMKLQDEKIKNLEKKINELENKNNENKNNDNKNNVIKNITSDKTITCHNKFKGGIYYLGSYQYFNGEKIDDKKNKLSGYYDKHIGQNWFFHHIYEGNYAITYADNFHNLLNWRIYSNGNEVILSKDSSSLFTLLKVEEKENDNCFYIQDFNSKKYLYLTSNNREGGGYFIGLADKINQEEKDRFIFYYP